MNTLCPVCKQPVDPTTAPISRYADTIYYLRCPHCKQRFDADPERFLTATESTGCAHEGHACGRVNSEPRKELES